MPITKLQQNASYDTQMLILTLWPSYAYYRAKCQLWH